MAPTNERFSLRFEWVVLAGISLVALDAAVPSLRGREHETHAGIVQRLHEYADREVGMVHAEAAALGIRPVSASTASRSGWWAGSRTRPTSPSS